MVVMENVLHHVVMEPYGILPFEKNCKNSFCYSPVVPNCQLYSSVYVNWIKLGTSKTTAKLLQLWHGTLMQQGHSPSSVISSLLFLTHRLPQQWVWGQVKIEVANALMFCQLAKPKHFQRVETTSETQWQCWNFWSGLRSHTGLINIPTPGLKA